MADRLRILVVDDDRLIRKYLGDILKKRDFHVESAEDGAKALALFGEKRFDVVVTDLIMPRMGGLGLLAELKERCLDVAVIVMTGRGTVETAVQAIKQGAYDFIEKPVDPEKFLTIIDRVAGHKRLWERSVEFKSDRRRGHRFENIIGHSPKMHQLFEEIRNVSKTDASVLIMGENGTGKELVADAIHYGRSRGKPYVKVNCGALAESVVESELFGHEKGAFTGATSRKRGKIEMANGGTLFLDEIGEFTPSVQVKLLRVLESGEFQRVGGVETLKADFRLISATNKNLADAVLNREFREDLYYRINTVTITIPPLRERRADVPLLAAYFLKRYSKQAKKSVRTISGEAMKLFMRHDWPDNVRELSHAIERGVVYCKGTQIVPGDLPPGISAILEKKEITVTAPSKSLADVESSHIYNILVESRWNLKQAARMLNIARGTPYGKMERYGIKKPD